MGKIAALLMVVGLLTVTILNAVEITQDNQTNITSHESAWQEPDGPCRGDEDCPEATVCYAETCESCLAFTNKADIPERCKDIFSVTPALPVNDVDDTFVCKVESDCPYGSWCYANTICESCAVINSLDDLKIHCPYWLEAQNAKSSSKKNKKKLKMVIGLAVGSSLLILLIIGLVFWELKCKTLRRWYQKRYGRVEAPEDNNDDEETGPAFALQNTEPPAAAAEPLLQYENENGAVNNDQNEAERKEPKPEHNPTGRQETAESGASEDSGLTEAVQPVDYDKSPAVYPA